MNQDDLDRAINNLKTTIRVSKSKIIHNVNKEDIVALMLGYQELEAKLKLKDK